MIHHQLITEILGTEDHKPIHSYILNISDSRLMIVTTDIYRRTRLQLVSIDDTSINPTDSLLFIDINLIQVYADRIDDNHICITMYDIYHRHILITTYSVEDGIFLEIDRKAIDMYDVLNLKCLTVADNCILIHYVVYNDTSDPFLRFILYTYDDKYCLTYKCSYISDTISSINYMLVKLKDNKVCVLYSEIRTSRLCLSVLLIDQDNRKCIPHSSFYIVNQMIYNMAMVVLNDEHILLYYTYGFIEGHNVLVVLRINGNTTVLKDIEYADSANYHTTLSYDDAHYILYVCGSKLNNNSNTGYVSYVSVLDIVSELSIPNKIFTKDDRYVKHITSVCTNSGDFIVFKCLNEYPYSILSQYRLKAITNE